MEHSPDDPQETHAHPPSVPPSHAHFGSLSPAQQAARRELHEQEVRERLNQLGIAATPGIDFDPARGRHFLRFSYCGPEADMAEAAARLRAWGG